MYIRNYFPRALQAHNSEFLNECGFQLISLKIVDMSKRNFEKFDNEILIQHFIYRQVKMEV